MLRRLGVLALPSRRPAVALLRTRPLVWSAPVPARPSSLAAMRFSGSSARPVRFGAKCRQERCLLTVAGTDSLTPRQGCSHRAGARNGPSNGDCRPHPLARGSGALRVAKPADRCADSPRARSVRGFQDHHHRPLGATDHRAVGKDEWLFGVGDEVLDDLNVAVDVPDGYAGREGGDDFDSPAG